eukprot:TRINITY_DN3362_c0_g1_i1.p1 TRINITY_DN3362_c0_g1~~TRINITY_DN3362_c0_g1_i1.p1  ORF type:complete len:358 (+),score=51.15 TRINITY_DN3362_c0_g1_i1:381-1454(+)
MAMLSSKEGCGRAAQVFRDLDKNGNGKMEYEEFKRGLAKHNIYLNQPAFNAITKVLDSKGDGHIDFAEFSAKYRTPVSPQVKEATLRRQEQIPPHLRSHFIEHNIVKPGEVRTRTSKNLSQLQSDGAALVLNVSPDRYTTSLTSPASPTSPSLSRPASLDLASPTSPSFDTATTAPIFPSVAVSTASPLSPPARPHSAKQKAHYQLYSSGTSEALNIEQGLRNSLPQHKPTLQRAFSASAYQLYGEGMKYVMTREHLGQDSGSPSRPSSAASSRNVSPDRPRTPTTPTTPTNGTSLVGIEYSRDEPTLRSSRARDRPQGHQMNSPNAAAVLGKPSPEERFRPGRKQAVGTWQMDNFN